MATEKNNLDPALVEKVKQAAAAAPTEARIRSDQGHRKPAWWLAARSRPPGTVCGCRPAADQAPSGPAW